jgi:hypothetical protein
VPAEQGPLVGQPQLGQACRDGRVGLPLPGGAFVSAEVQVVSGEERQDLVEHVAVEPERRLGDVEHVLADAPVDPDVELAAGVAELPVRGYRRLRVAGAVDFGHDGDEPRGGVRHDLSDVLLRVVAAVPHPVVLAGGLPGVSDQGGGPPRSDLDQPRVALNLQPPALVVGEVQVQDVELVQREQVDEAQHELLGHEVSCHVEHRAAPAEPGGVGNLEVREADDLAGRVVRHQLAQCLGAVEHPGGYASGDLHAPLVDGEPVGLRCEAVVEGQAHRGVGDHGAGGPGHLCEPVGDPLGLRSGGDRHRPGDRQRAGKAADRCGMRDQRGHSAA